jgi:Transposase
MFVISSADFTVFLLGVVVHRHRNRTRGGAHTEGRGEANGFVSSRSHVRQRATLVSGTGQPNGRLRTVSRGRCHWCAATTIDELHALAGTVETWWPEIEAFLDTGITNAKTEGLNRLVIQVKRCGCGFRNVDNPHRRVRFHCTRKRRAATAASRSLPAQV